MTTNKGRVVYNRKKHMYTGFAFFRAALGAFPRTETGWRTTPEEYFFLHATLMYLNLLLGEDSFRKTVGTIPALDLQELPYLVGEKKMTKKWQAYRVLRDHILERWSAQVVEDAKQFFLGILDLVLEFEEPIELVKELWAMIK